MAILVIYCKMHYISLKKTSSFHLGRDRTNFFSNDEQGLNSKYENSTFQDSWGRGSPAMVWPYWSFKLNLYISWPLGSGVPGEGVANLVIEIIKENCKVYDPAECKDLNDLGHIISAAHAGLSFI